MVIPFDRGAGLAPLYDYKSTGIAIREPHGEQLGGTPPAARPYRLPDSGQDRSWPTASLAWLTA
jgi:hypothetical protein